MTQNSCTESSGTSWPTGGELVVVRGAVEQDVRAGCAQAVDLVAGSAVRIRRLSAATLPDRPTRSYTFRVIVGSSRISSAETVVACSAFNTLIVGVSETT